MLVFDVTALVALFHAHPPVFEMWRRADEGTLRLGFPALAIVEAGTILQASATSWDAVLWPPAIEVLPLHERVAAEIGAWHGSPGSRHALWEAQALRCTLITRQPELYSPDEVSIRAV